jgi:ankyrin repeat protein/Cdc6-like AAA superfamily ATPase
MRDIKSDTKAIKAAQELKDLLDWIGPDDYSPSLRKHSKMVCTWILTHEKFLDWITTPTSTLFCIGNPGTGKTVMSASVINHLLAHHDQAKVAVCYLFLEYTRKAEQTSPALLTSLLRQLVSAAGSISACSKHLSERHRKNSPLSSTDEIFEELIRICARFDQIYLVVDGLDESDPAIVRELVSTLRRLSPESNDRVHIMATSRRIPTSEDLFANDLTLEIDPKVVTTDIELYLTSEMSTLSVCVQENNDLKRKITEEIMEIANGVFLLVHLHVESLVGLRTVKAVKTALEAMNSDTKSSTPNKATAAYDTAYERAMQRIMSQSGEDAKYAIEVLTWVVFAQRRMRTVELQHAVAVEDESSSMDPEALQDIRELLSVCAGLVTLDGSGERVELVHKTAQEYFERNFHKWHPSPHLKIAHTCVTYLLFSFDGHGPPKIVGWDFAFDHVRQKWLFYHPLYDFAATYWGYHTRCVSHGEISPDLDCFVTLTKALARAPQAIKHAYTWYARFESRNPAPTGLHLAAMHGTATFIALLLDGDDIGIQSNDNLTPLHLAAKYGQIDAADTLIVSGRFPVDSTAGSEKSTPLLLAVEYDQPPLVHRLLATKQVGLNVCDAFGRTPLIIAVERLIGRRSRSVELLTPIHEAHKGNFDVIETLLREESIDKNISETRTGRTAIHIAIIHGASNGSWGPVSRTLCSLLIQNGLDINIRDSNKIKPIAYAVASGCPELVSLLLNIKPPLQDITGDWNGGLAFIARLTEMAHFGDAMYLLQNGYSVDFTTNAYVLAILQRAVRATTDVPVLVNVEVTAEELEHDFLKKGGAGSEQQAIADHSSGTARRDSESEHLKALKYFQILMRTLRAAKKIGLDSKGNEGTGRITLSTSVGLMTLAGDILYGADILSPHHTPLSLFWQAVIRQSVEVDLHLP